MPSRGDVSWDIFSSIRYEKQYPYVYIANKRPGMCADYTVKRCGMSRNRKRTHMCKRIYRNSVFITSSHWLQWWYTLLRYPHIQYTLILNELIPFLRRFIHLHKKNKRRDVQEVQKKEGFAHQTCSQTYKELKARWTQVDPSQSGKPHFVQTHWHD